MNNICVPIPRLASSKNAEVQVNVAGEQRIFNYRVESFDWHPDHPQRSDEQLPQEDFLLLRTNRINLLKDRIEGYDRNWELIQIYNPGPKDDHIQVLFRQKGSTIH